MSRVRKLGVAAASVAAGLVLSTQTASAAPAGSTASLRNCIDRAVHDDDVADGVSACVTSYLAALDAESSSGTVNTVILGSSTNGGINTAILGSADGDGAVNTGILGHAATL